MTEMAETIWIGNNTVQAVVSEFRRERQPVIAGKSNQVSATIHCSKADFLAAGGGEGSAVKVRGLRGIIGPVFPLGDDMIGFEIQSAHQRTDISDFS